MRVIWFGAALVLAVTGVARAQVTVEIELDQDQFLRDESLPLRVRITNRSGQSLRLGEGAGWLRFSVERLNGHPVAQRGQLGVEEAFVLESSKAAIRHVDVMPYFDLSEPDRYKVQATVWIPQWERELTSAPVQFDIGRGVKTWEQAVGVPGTGPDPEVRVYALVQANYEKRPMLYARVTDLKEAKVFKVVPLGPLLNFSRPERATDKESRLHVLFQTGAHTFRYLVVDPNGEVKVRQTYAQSGTRPMLRGEDGKLEIKGGTRTPKLDDLPEEWARTKDADPERKP